MYVDHSISHLDVGVGGAAHVEGGKLSALDRRHIEALGIEVILKLVLELAQVFLPRVLLDLELLLDVHLLLIVHKKVLVVLFLSILLFVLWPLLL